MALHKTRSDHKFDPNQPGSTIMANGRHTSRHAMIDDKPVLGGIQNAVVEGVGRTEEEDKLHDEQYEKNRETVKQTQAEAFDEKTGKPKPQELILDTELDRAVTPEVAETVKVEKKPENVVEKKPDVKPVGPHNPKADEKDKDKK